MGPADGEVYVMCGECGARLWSCDSRIGEKYLESRCPYKRDGKCSPTKEDE